MKAEYLLSFKYYAFHLTVNTSWMMPKHQTIPALGYNFSYQQLESFNPKPL